MTVDEPLATDEPDDYDPDIADIEIGRRVRTPRSDASRRLPGRILAVASVLPAVVAAAWVAGALVLLWFHVYVPVTGTLLALAITIVIARPVVRVALASADRLGDVPWWALIAVLAVVVLAGGLAFAHSAEDVLVRRDPGSYAMSATWLSTHGTILMPAHPQVFGAPNSDLVLASQGFYEQGSHIIPQFMTGAPVLLSIGGWMAGVSGVLHGNAFLGAFALLAFAGLAARLVGARWAPLAVLALAFVQPELDVMRATYSEPAGQLLLLGGLAIVVDGFVAGQLMPGLWPRLRRNAGGESAPDDAPPLAPNLAANGLFVGGLVLGLVFTVRIDAVADLFPLVPFVGWLAFHRILGWKRFAGGLVLGLAFGGFDCLFLTYPYAQHVGPDLAKVGLGFTALSLWALAVFALARWRQRRDAGGGAWRSSPWYWRIGLVVAVVVSGVLPLLTWIRGVRRRLPILAAIGVFLIGLFFFLRPHLMTMRANPESGGANYVEQVQRFLHMSVDPTRSYYEQATRWLSWYLGWGTLALALIGACWLAYEQTAGHRRVWAPAFLVCFGSAVWVLFAPSITPDHPWADRRFVPVVLPGLVLFALIAIVPVLPFIASRTSRAWSADSSARPVLVGALQGAVGALAVLIIVVPVWTGSRDVIYTKTEVGEPTLVHQVCSQLRPGDVVIAIGGRARTEWPGTMKVMCGVNVGYLGNDGDLTEMSQIYTQVHADGGRLMLLAESEGDKNAADLEAAWPDEPTASLITSEATHTLVTRPGKPTKFLTQMWLGEYRLGGS
ncbi:MAG TPA: hypothetical protein VFG00_12410 [Acidothermaceae bacterium]|nr:hypothetical protein [Acidothermaceae bacterium]